MIHPRMMSVAAVVWAGLAAPVVNAKTFADGNFNLADYDITQLQTGGGSIDVSASSTAGQPAPSLTIITTTPASPQTQFNATEYFLGKAFTYDPTVEGAISSIDWSLDVYASIPNFNIAFLGGAIIVKQNGNIYIHGANVAPIQGVFETAAQSGVKQNNFNLMVDLTTGATNSSLHPDFSSGVMQFGTISGWMMPVGLGPATVDVKLDNLRIDVTAVPEPDTLALLLSGLVMVGLGSKIRRRQQA
jgi:hypothetical protein